MILDTLKNVLANYPTTSLVVAYSGGVDSQVLLHALTILKNKNLINHSISACHINHGLSKNAEDWQIFAKQQCDQYGIAYSTYAVVVEKQPRQSLEAIAREKRYQVLEKYSDEQSLVLTGHHQDDQVETFLLALKRGSGLKGLSAMAVHSPFGDKQQAILRPFLSCSRQEIVDYANENGLQWVEDESNQDTQFDRNFLRQVILPEFQQRWTSINQTIVRSAQHCQDAQNILDEIAEQDIARCAVEKNILEVEALTQLSVPRFNQVIRYLLAQHNFLMPSLAQLSQLHQQLFAEDDKSPEVKLGEVWLRKYKKHLYLTKTFQPLESWQYELDITDKSIIDEPITLPDELGQLIFSTNDALSIDDTGQNITIPKLCKRLSISFTHINPICLPEYRQHSRVLKKVLQELNIPPWQRKRLPFLYLDGELAAVIGKFTCKPFLINKSSSVGRKINVHWLGQA